MRILPRVRGYLWIGALAAIPCAAAAPGPTASARQVRAADRDASHDFDFEVGAWRTHLKRLPHPLTGSTEWVECDGTTSVRKVWGGRANLVELEVDCPGGHLEGMNLRLYNPQSHQWSLNFANSSDGTLTQPTIGGFENGRGEFFDREMLGGRPILVRFEISDVTSRSCHFEQAFSGDGGRSWEVNWIATDTRVDGDAQGTRPRAATRASAPSIASVMDVQLKIVESQFVPAAEAMPADKYPFVPVGGEYKGVRTFAQEVKHVATANVVFYSAILGQAPPPGVTLAGATNGPDDIRTKEQIVKYLKDSFALGHTAFATLTRQNAVTPLAKPPVPLMNTRLAMASFSCAHASDHYGQMVEYLRMNGIVPPASNGQPPANPGAR